MNVSIPVDFSERVGTETPSRSMFERATRMVYTPDTEWPLIAREQGGFQDLLVPYTLWVALAPAVLGVLLPLMFLSALLFYTGGSPATLITGLWHMVWGYIGELLIILVASKVLSLMSASWKASTSWLLWTRVLVYGSTPYFLSAAFVWVPFLGILFSFACGVRSAMLIRAGYQAILKSGAVAEPATVAIAG